MTTEDRLSEALIELSKTCTIHEQTIAKLSEIIGQLDFGEVVAVALNQEDAGSMFQHTKREVEYAIELAEHVHTGAHNVKISLSECLNECMAANDGEGGGTI